MSFSVSLDFCTVQLRTALSSLCFEFSLSCLNEIRFVSPARRGKIIPKVEELRRLRKCLSQETLSFPHVGCWKMVSYICKSQGDSKKATCEPVLAQLRFWAYSVIVWWHSDKCLSSRLKFISNCSWVRIVIIAFVGLSIWFHRNGLMKLGNNEGFFTKEKEVHLASLFTLP